MSLLKHSWPVTRVLSAAAAALLLSSCVGKAVDESPDTVATTAQTPPASPPPAAGTVTGAPMQPAAPTSDMSVEVDLATRKLHLSRGGSRIASHDVAVGSKEWPTQTGEWNITQVVFNPEWVPPDESWAKDEEAKQPGAADNPLGRVQLVYDPPRTIHGTNEPRSIGKAVSHGSIRVSNEVGLQLARQIMEAAGVTDGEAQMNRAASNRSEKIIVQLPSPVPIRVR